MDATLHQPVRDRIDEPQVAFRDPIGQKLHATPRRTEVPRPEGRAAVTLGENTNGPEDVLRPRKLSLVAGTSNQSRSIERGVPTLRQGHGTLQMKLGLNAELRLW